MRVGDLHLHTNVSDGRLSPTDVVKKVVAAGLGFFSITDHNSIAGQHEAKEAVPAGGPRCIYGVELSAQPNGAEELHVLGYGFDPADDGLLAMCRQLTQRKKDQLRAIVMELRLQGVDVYESELAFGDDDNYVGRPVLAELLVRKGVVRSMNQAFVRHLRPDTQTYVPMVLTPVKDVIEAIQAAGGLAVLAHPTIDTVDRWLAPLAELGLDGIETYRPALSGNEQLYVEKAAEHFGIFVTGGSDSHARGDDDQPGSFTVSEALLAGFFEALGGR